jgi:hypothetical protein
MNKQSRLCIIASMIICIAIELPAQVGISSDSSAPDPSAGLDLKFTDKGFLAPRMTFAQRSAIVNPAEGLLVVCTNCKTDGTGCLSIYLGGKWLILPAICSEPAPPTGGIPDESNTQIIWKWNAVPIATGYRWNVTNDFASATSMDTVTTKTETGLTIGNQYTRYVWAYNDCGYSAPTTLNAQALTCGTSFTIIHTAGNVAPVSKTVTYGTATNNSGEPATCWITQNLGSDHQATAVNDATEASAGWYWQVNKKQGYKVADDGVTRTPNATWIYPISDDSDWSASNDPCTIELGSGWRIPTYAEWANLDATGDWTNWNGPWNSALKMHAAGALYFTDGSLYNRGSSSAYWSSTQYNAGNGLTFGFSNEFSDLGTNDKSLGCSLRCIRK